MIDLAKGHPSTRLLALKELAVATQTVLSKFADLTDAEIAADDRHVLQYGSDQGPLQVRRTFAEWFTDIYQLNRPVDPDLLAISCGASYGLANTLLQFADAQYTRRIFMITPAYFLAARIFQDAGFGDKLCAVKEDEDGFSVASLTKILESDVAEHATSGKQRAVMAGKRYRYLFYCVPTFSNPSGIIWTLERRIELVRLAKKYDILLCSDEVYDLLDYRGDNPEILKPPIKRLVDIDRESLDGDDQDVELFGNTISNMSFSKYLGPGMRCGTIQAATKSFATQWAGGGANHSGGNTAQMTSYFIAEMVRSGAIQSVLTTLRRVYKDRSKKLLAALRSKMPSGTRIHGGLGGYFIWVQLPPGYPSMEVILRSGHTGLASEEISVLPGSAFEVPGNEQLFQTRWFRVSLSLIEAEEAVVGIEHLAELIKQSHSL